MKSAGTEADYFVYVLRCEGGELYCGITTDVGRRLREHLSGRAPGARYTRTHRPVELVALWGTQGRAAASRLEYRFKRLDRARKDAVVASPQLAGGLVPTLEGGCGYQPLWPV